VSHLPTLLAAAGLLGAASASDTTLQRASRAGTQTWNAPPERVLPLLTPLGEKAWAVGWEPQMRYQAPGNGEGTLFVVRSHGGGETIWVLQTFDAVQLRVAYVHVSPGALVVELSLHLTALPEGRTRADVRYTFTALSAVGNARIEENSEPHFADFMRDWERELNYFLQTGRKLEVPHG
jgi:hypothetical protein